MDAAVSEKEKPTLSILTRFRFTLRVDQESFGLTAQATEMTDKTYNSGPRREGRYRFRSAPCEDRKCRSSKSSRSI